MSDTQQPVRVVLGPIARNLIEGAGNNRGKALDDAIQTLMEDAQRTPSQPADHPALAERIDALADTIRSQGEILSALRKTLILEQRMTRLYFATMTSNQTEEQRELVEMAQEAIDDLIDSHNLLDEQEKERLRNREEVAEAAMWRDLERGFEELEPENEPELER